MGSTTKPVQLLLISGVLILLIVAVYAQMRGHDAIFFDDNGYVTNNYIVQRGLTSAGFQYAFTTDTLSNWHPLTWLSHMLDCQLFGMDMGLHHITSLVLHIVDTLLLLLLLHQLTGAVWRPALVAALFALHPLNVESVAWIAERKNVLSMMFWLLTTMSYVGWVRRPSAGRYVRTLVLFALGLMAKPMLVTLPCTLLLLDYWPLGRTRFLALAGPEGAPAPIQLSLRRLLLEKLPFFVLVLGSSFITYYLQRTVANQGMETIPLVARLGNAVSSYAGYLLNTVWPHDLGVLYPLQNYLDGRFLVAGALLIPLLIWLGVRARTRQPYFLVGWLWYLGTLVPVIGIVQVGSQTMADRYAYVPLVGVFVMIAWGAAAIVTRWPHIRNAVVACSAVVVLALGVMAWRQTAYWKDSIALFEHTISVTEDNLVLHTALGTALGSQGRHDEAIPHFLETLRLKPESPEVLNNLGIAYASLDRHDEAMKCFRESIAMKPASHTTQTSLGLALAREGKSEEALEHYHEALRLDPDYPEAHTSLGSLLASMEKYDEAIEHFRRALALNPRMLQTHTNLGLVLEKQGQLDAAIESFQRSLAIDPDQSEVHAYLGDVLASQGRAEEAAVHYALVTRLDPGNVERNLAIAREFVRQGRLEPAIASLTQILIAHPDDVAAHIELGNALVARGEFDSAIPHLEFAVKNRPDDVEAHMNLGLAYDGTGNPERASEQYRAVLRVDPKLVVAHNKLAYALADAGKLDEAAAQFNESLTLDPKQPQVRNSLGYLVAAQGKLDEAIVHFNDALALDPNQPQVLNNLGNAYQHKGQLDEAIARFKEVLRLDPAHTNAAINLASALTSQGKLDEAIATYTELLARNPGNAKVHYNVGFLLGRQGKVAEAVAHFEECVRLEPDHALALYQLGIAAAMANQAERAIELHRESLRHAPDHPEALMSLAWIYATNANAKVRDGAEAVRLATRASELLRGQHVGALMTLAAAFAQDGKFSEAAETAQRAIELAGKSGQQDLVKSLEEAAGKYRAGQLMYPVK